MSSSLPVEKIYLCVCLPVMASHCAMKFYPSIDSVDIKYAICGCINCIPLQRKAVWRETRPFRPRAGDVIHPVLWLVKGYAVARLVKGAL